MPRKPPRISESEWVVANIVWDQPRITSAEVLERLPDDYREVILLRNMEGLSHEEVAQRMDRGVGAVRMLWVRALARLRQELATTSSA